MDARELRIRNYIYKEGKIHQVDGIDFGLARREADYNIKIFKPIPLSEEWLVKFGFGKSDQHESGHNADPVFGFYYDWHFKRFYLEVESERVRIDHIKYVHSLQNLFHSLTGSELTIKE
jgi:hypothetical protein